MDRVGDLVSGLMLDLNPRVPTSVVINNFPRFASD